MSRNTGKGNRQAGCLLQQVQHGQTGLANCCPVPLAGLLVIAGQGAQLRALLLVVGVLGQDVDIGAGGWRLQFDAAAEDAQQRGGLVDR